MQHSQIIVHILFPANQDVPKAVQPTVGAFHYPAPGPVTRHLRLPPLLFAPAYYMGRVSPPVYQLFYLGIIVPLV